MIKLWNFTNWLEKKQIIEKRVDETFWFQLIFTSTGRHGLGLKVSISIETFDFLNQCWFYQYWIKKITNEQTSPNPYMVKTTCNNLWIPWW